jgi:hypothetical protein
MTNETKTTNETDRRVAELERELAHVRRQNRMLECVRRQTFRAMFEFMHLPKAADEHSCRLQLLDYVKHLGHHYYLPPDWDKAHKELHVPEGDLLEHTAR